MSRRATSYQERIADPRKLSDKKYMEASVRKLILFLTQHNYDQDISPKVLTRPANKDYFNILRFLLKMIDPHIVSTRGGRDFTKCVPEIFKNLKYPFNVSKAALTFVGVPHTWPSVLATLTWMVELLWYDEAVENEKIRNNDFESQPLKVFFSYLKRTYQAFLQGLDEEFQAIEDEVKQEFVERNGKMKVDIVRLKKSFEQFQDEHAKLEGTEAYISKMRQRKVDYEEDLQKFKALIEKLEAHTLSLERKMSSRERHQTEQAASLAAAKKERDRLRVTLENQDLSPKDVQRMTERRKQLKYALTSLRTNSREREQKMIWDLEIKQTKTIEELGDCVRQYNDMLHTMELAPPVARYAEGRDLQVNMNVHAEVNGELLSQDVASTIRSALANVEMKLLKASHDAKSSTLLLEEESDVLKDSIVDAKMKTEEMRRQIRRKEETVSKELSDADRKCQEATEAYNDVELRVQRLEVECNQKTNELEEFQAELERLRTIQMKNREEYGEEEQAFTDRVVPLLSSFTDHKEQSQEALQRVVAHCRTRLEELSSSDSKSPGIFPGASGFE